MMTKLKFIFIFTFVFYSLYFQSVTAANLHAFIVCDTHADNIEKSVQADYRRILNEIKYICKLTKLKPKIKTFTGYNVDSDFVNKLDSLNVKPDDVIIFYWSGHGKRFDFQENPWPVFDFTYDDIVVSQYTITQLLMDKHPRLILSIADCCNDYLGKSLILESRKISNSKKNNYRKLFLDSSGTYIATAALPGEFSFGLNRTIREWNLPPGGYYTTAFLEVLDEETSVKNPTISWDLLFTLTGEKTIGYQLRDVDDPTVYHHPQFLYIAN
jgi:hypothetical protein